MVPPDWQHPKDGFYADGNVRYVALFEGSDFAAKAADWAEESAKWAAGEFPAMPMRKAKSSHMKNGQALNLTQPITCRSGQTLNALTT
jgi:hypothetical protein